VQTVRCDTAGETYHDSIISTVNVSQPSQHEVRQQESAHLASRSKPAYTLAELGCAVKKAQAACSTSSGARPGSGSCPPTPPALLLSAAAAVAQSAPQER
jgi:hypothetical protein